MYFNASKLPLQSTSFHKDKEPFSQLRGGGLVEEGSFSREYLDQSVEY